MLPFIGPEMFDWLLTWCAAPELVATSERPVVARDEESNNDQTKGRSRPQRRSDGVPLKWRKY
jgi:hypothetical protein